MERSEIVNIVREALSKRDGMTAKEIIDKLNAEKKDSLFAEGVDEKEIKSILQEESKLDKGDIMRCAKKKKGALQYKLRPAQTPLPGAGRKKNKPSTDVDDTNRIGKAGEMAVLSELTFRGYNVTSMTVDEGIDLVASKDNIFYFIQVKTTYLDALSRFSVQIPVESYNRVKQNNVIYIFVLREEIGRMRYFIFHQNDIHNETIKGYIEQTDSNIIIKVEYDSANHTPYLYNGKNRTSAKCYQAEEKNFDL